MYDPDDERNKLPRIQIVFKGGFFLTIACGLLLVLYGTGMLVWASDLQVTVWDPTALPLLAEYVKGHFLRDIRVLGGVFVVAVGALLIILPIVQKICAGIRWMKERQSGEDRF